MIGLFGLEGYTGQRIAPSWMVLEQKLLWQADIKAENERRQQENEQAKELQRQANG